MSWLAISDLERRSIWPPLNKVKDVDRIIVHEQNQFVIYEVDNHIGSHTIYDRDKIFPFGKQRWFRKDISDREALEAAIIYANEIDGSNPYRAMAAEIVEIQSVVDGL